ncbi:ParA family protein [Corynebacterium urinipleomorphum]|uniref:ParA family protein n=1 Tax=Corynebacterium urinipleomorphum TaxID=1852380 RepID=UPI00138FCC87|nr:AAA family ATPase [Corynebacterium urinipleomorphum]
MSCKVIALFNNKGGVSKTTTCFNLGWKLAELGKKVILVDADPQCNLSGLTLESESEDLISETYQSFESVNLYSSLLPAMKSTGTKIEAPDLPSVAGNDDLLLLPGNVKLAEVETQLATAMSVGGMLPAMQNVPGSFKTLYGLLADKYDTDYILIDMSPSLGALNQVNFLNADYFIVPVIPDIFSVMAIKSLSTAIPSWLDWARKVNQLGMFNDPDLLYKFEPTNPKFLGTVIQRYRLRNGMPSRSFEQYFHYLDEAVDSIFIPEMRKNKLIPDRIADKPSASMRLAEIPDFNSLIASSQAARKPVYTLSDNELKIGGAALHTQKQKIEQFRSIFTDFAHNVIDLTS